MITNEELISEALKFVNFVRQDTGREALTELPKGRPDNVCLCPVAKGVSHNPDRPRCPHWMYASETEVVFALSESDEVKHYVYPAEVRAFVARFDEGEIPELIE